MRSGMTVTDPQNPDPMNDPRTTQADPGANGQGDDLASAGDDPAADGDDPAADGGGLPLEGGIPSTGGADPEPDVDTGGPFTQVAPPS
jgi:hypothetical protein